MKLIKHPAYTFVVLSFAMALAACGRKPESVSKYVPEEELSSVVVPESDLAKVNCNYINAGYSSELQCAQPKTARENFEQNIEVLKYSRKTSNALNDESINKRTKIVLIGKSALALKQLMDRTKKSIQFSATAGTRKGGLFFSLLFDLASYDRIFVRFSDNGESFVIEGENSIQDADSLKALHYMKEYISKNTQVDPAIGDALMLECLEALESFQGSGS